jgi:hypothetical protein
MAWDKNIVRIKWRDEGWQPWPEPGLIRRCIARLLRFLHIIK